MKPVTLADLKGSLTAFQQADASSRGIASGYLGLLTDEYVKENIRRKKAPSVFELNTLADILEQNPACRTDYVDVFCGSMARKFSPFGERTQLSCFLSYISWLTLEGSNDAELETIRGECRQHFLQNPEVVKRYHQYNNVKATLQQ